MGLHKPIIEAVGLLSEALAATTDQELAPIQQRRQAEAQKIIRAHDEGKCTLWGHRSNLQGNTEAEPQELPRRLTRGVWQLVGDHLMPSFKDARPSWKLEPIVIWKDVTVEGWGQRPELSDHELERLVTAARDSLQPQMDGTMGDRRERTWQNVSRAMNRAQFDNKWKTLADRPKRGRPKKSEE